MAKIAAKTKRGQKGPAVRVGRPPQELAGEVDERILDAARRAFLERGLAGASIEEIARRARAGKPTIYARFPTKEALFSAVAMRNAAAVRGRIESYEPAGGTIEERLVSVGTNILERLLDSNVIEFMRLSVAEARRFPELANVGRIARERAAEAVAQVLGEVARSDGIGTFAALAPEYLATTTRFFLDLVVGRLLMRAMFGENLKLLRAEIDAHVARSVSFFLAACRQGGIK